MDNLRVNAQSVGIGLVLAGMTYLTIQFLPSRANLPFHAVLLAGIGAVYLGFSLADGRIKTIAIEATGATAFLGLAVIGLVYNPIVLIAGYFAHGIWDLLHHNSRIPGDFAGWYIPFCTSYDWAVGAYLWYLL